MLAMLTVLLANRCSCLVQRVAIVPLLYIAAGTAAAVADTE